MSKEAVIKDADMLCIRLDALQLTDTRAGFHLRWRHNSNRHILSGTAESCGHLLTFEFQLTVFRNLNGEFKYIVA